MQIIICEKGSISTLLCNCDVIIKFIDGTLNTPQPLYNSVVGVQSMNRAS